GPKRWRRAVLPGPRLSIVPICVKRGDEIILHDKAFGELAGGQDYGRLFERNAAALREHITAQPAECRAERPELSLDSGRFGNRRCADRHAVDWSRRTNVYEAGGEHCHD